MLCSYHPPSNATSLDAHPILKAMKLYEEICAARLRREGCFYSNIWSSTAFSCPHTFGRVLQFNFSDDKLVTSQSFEKRDICQLINTVSMDFWPSLCILTSIYDSSLADIWPCSSGNRGRRHNDTTLASCS